MDERMALLQVPVGLLEALSDGANPTLCPPDIARDAGGRTMINIVMVILTTDYKRDQIHLPEILKRIR